jgi:hypothetical protein
MTMTEQFTFDYSTPITRKEQFEVFHARNPHIYKMLEAITRVMLKRGASKVGINHICEIARWEHFKKTDDPNSTFEINNNYRPHYARLLIKNHPEWASVFELREIRST